MKNKKKNHDILLFINFIIKFIIDYTYNIYYSYSFLQNYTSIYYKFSFLWMCTNFLSLCVLKMRCKVNVYKKKFNYLRLNKYLQLLCKK